jgi:hypothetical protein
VLVIVHGAGTFSYCLGHVKLLRYFIVVIIIVINILIIIIINTVVVIILIFIVELYVQPASTTVSDT